MDAFVDALLAWGAQERRDLPWRHTRDPWAVLVSELMLQQTQVSRVVPKYHAFLERFPDPSTCAAAAAGDVVRAWAGLGYNRRALNLHRTAVVVTERHDGDLPSTLDELLALPGIGPYTARAVLAFAFEADAAVVDTNAGRVLARAVAGRRLAPAEAQTAADRLVPPGRAWVWNSAVLDLGARICTSRPRCEACPVAAACAWHRAGRAAPDPAVRSAAVSVPQPPLAGSDRQGRGRLVDALRRGSVRLDDVAAVAGWPADPLRAERVASGLVADGLAVRDGTRLRLP